MANINWDLAPEGAVAIKMDMSNNLYWVNDKNVYYDAGNCWSNCSHHTSWQTIATRPQPEQPRKTAEDADAKSEPEWTHTWNGNKCRVVFTEDYRSWIKSDALDTLVPTDSLKPIKPTITKAEAWDYAVDGGLYAEEIEKKYTITD